MECKRFGPKLKKVSTNEGNLVSKNILILLKMITIYLRFTDLAVDCFDWFNEVFAIEFPKREKIENFVY